MVLGSSVASQHNFCFEVRSGLGLLKNLVFAVHLTSPSNYRLQSKKPGFLAHRARPMDVNMIISNYINIWTYVSMVWLYHISTILTEVIPIFSPQLRPGVAWQVPIRGRITLVADHVTEFYGCSGRVLRSPLANVPANCRATFLCFVTLFWLSLSLLTLLKKWHCSRGFSRRVHFQLAS